MNDRPHPTASLAPDTLFRRGTLEFGPKSLFRKDDGFLDGFFAELLRSYRQLLKHCDAVSLLFWLGDGTEILQYDGPPDAAFSARFPSRIGLRGTPRFTFLEIRAAPGAVFQVGPGTADRSGAR